MEIAYVIAAFVALTLAAWALEQFLDLSVKRLLRSIWTNIRGGRDEQLGDPDLTRVTSKFATSANELDTVLQLRSAYFGPDVIVPDETYRQCWRQNEFAFKIVYVDSAPVGYWGVVPISDVTYTSFVRGAVTHDQMLGQHVLRWDTITEPVRLYIIGAVVPLVAEVPERYRSCLKGYLTRHVLLDMYSFAVRLMIELNVSDVAGYPSKLYGRQALSRPHGFRRTDTLIDGNPTQPIFVLEDGAAFKAFAERRLERLASDVPHWDEKDHKRFLDVIRSRPRNTDEQTFAHGAAGRADSEIHVVLPRPCER